MRTVIPLSLGILILIVSGLRWRLPDRAGLRVLARPLWLVASLVALGVTAVCVLHAPFFDWNAPRLAVSAALLSGFGIYAPPDRGPLLGHNYGPVSPLVYLPALLMSTPGAALAAGSLLAFLMVLLPVVVVLHMEGAGQRRLVWLACLTVWLVFLTEAVTRFTLFSIHADAPAIGLTILACAAVYRESHRKTRVWMTASALAAVLAVGSKQVAVPLLVVVPLWIWFVDGWPAMRRYMAVAVAVGLSTFGVVVFFVDARVMSFNALTVIASQGFKPGGWRLLLVRALRDLVPRLLPYLAAAAFAAAVDRGGADANRQLRAWFRARPWAVFVALAIASIPMALLGRSITGGSTNGLAYPLVFAMVGAALAYLNLARRGIPLLRVAAVPAVTWALTIVSGGLALIQAPTLQDLSPAVRSFRSNPDDAMLTFWRQHPGQVYLPFNPLIGLMADGAAFHFSWGLYSRELAGRTPSREHFWAHVPPDMKYVALYGKDLESDPIWPYLADFTSPVVVESLPGWHVRTRAGDSGRRAALDRPSTARRFVLMKARRQEPRRKRAATPPDEMREQVYVAVRPLNGRHPVNLRPTATYGLT